MSTFVVARLFALNCDSPHMSDSHNPVIQEFQTNPFESKELQLGKATTPALCLPGPCSLSYYTKMFHGLLQILDGRVYWEGKEQKTRSKKHQKSLKFSMQICSKTSQKFFGKQGRQERARNPSKCPRHSRDSRRFHESYRVAERRFGIRQV